MLLQKVADAGHAGAMVLLGCCYEVGEGVNKDDAESFKWFMKAANAGDISAMGIQVFIMKMVRVSNKTLQKLSSGIESQLMLGKLMQCIFQVVAM